MKTNMKKKGFTLVELLVVIAIIAILATVSVVGYTTFLDKANQSNADNEANQIEQAINAELIAGDDYVIGTVDKNEDADAAEGMQYADAATKTTYYVSAEDHKIYKVVETYVAADTKWTAAAAVAVDAAEPTKDADDNALITIDDAFAVNADFEGFSGSFAVSGAGKITYTYVEDVTAVIDFN